MKNPRHLSSNNLKDLQKQRNNERGKRGREEGVDKYDKWRKAILEANMKRE